jgi:hypothetical protein
MVSEPYGGSAHLEPGTHSQREVSRSLISILPTNVGANICDPRLKLTQDQAEAEEPDQKCEPYDG